MCRRRRRLRGSLITCSCCSFLTSRANTASAGTVESMQFALMEMMKLPPVFRVERILLAT